MNNFKEDLKANNKFDKKSFDDKVAEAVILAIQGIETKNKDEEIRKVEFMMNIDKFIQNFDRDLQVLIKNQINSRDEK